MKMNMITKAIALSVLALQAVEGFEKIAGFTPTTLVIDEAALDRDQDVIEEYLKKDTVADFATAKKVYEEGGNSGSYAVVTLDTALLVDAPSGTSVYFSDRSGDIATGTIKVDATTGTMIVEILYETFDDFDDSVKCKVGGLPAGKQKTAGCIDESFPVDIDGAGLYDVIAVENKNYRSLQSIILDLSEFPDLKAIRKDYYNSIDYANNWVIAVFDQNPSMGFKAAYDVFDSTLYGYTGRREFIKKGIVYMGTMMTTLKYSYDVYDICKNGKITDDMLKSIDLAWAYYVGSLQGKGINGGKNGKFFYALADKRCENGHTCGKEFDSFSGSSWVNRELLKIFKKMKKDVNDNKPCRKYKAAYNKIVSFMVLPLMQGTLRYALKKAINPIPNPNQEKEEAEGAVFYASILPFIYECDPAIGEIIFDEMKVGGVGGGNFGSDYSIVKDAFESVYKCKRLKYWSRQVGGIYPNSSSTLPYPGAEPECADFKYLKGDKSCKKKVGGGKANKKRCETEVKGKPYSYWCPKSCNITAVTPPSCFWWNLSIVYPY